VAMARRCVSEWPDLVERLAKAFWPGPLTMVLPRSSELPDIVTASGPTVGVRWSSHPFIQAVIRECGFPLAAPSANLSSQVSPTKALHVQNSLGNKIGLIVDGGQSQVGIESSVLDVTVAPPRLLRPGMIQSESLVAVTGDLMVGADRSAASLRSPGLLRKHYSPNAKLVICSWQDETDLRSQISNCGFAIADVHIIAHTRIPISGAFGRVSVIPHDATPLDGQSTPSCIRAMIQARGSSSLKNCLTPPNGRLSRIDWSGRRPEATSEVSCRCSFENVENPSFLKQKRATRGSNL